MRKYTFNITLIVMLLIAWTLFQIFKPTPVNWNPTLINTDKNPYGTYILFKEATALFPGQNISVSRLPIYNQLSDSSEKYYNYVLISPAISPSNEDLQKLREFVKSGNHVFIASENFSDSFCDSLGIKQESHMDILSSNDTTYHFCNSTIDKGHYLVPSFSHGYFTVSDSTLKVTALMEDMQKRKAMLKIEMGEGSLILCTIPLMFSNWFLLREGMSAIPFKALSYLPADRPLVWDEYQKQGRDEDPSILRAILANKALSWAYFLSLFGILLVLVFETRRRRSMVPIVVPLKNTTLEFVKVVGLLHFEQRNFSDIARKKLTYFLERIRVHYYLPTLKTDQDFTVALSEKSGYGLAETEKLVNVINFVRYTRYITADDLIELNKSIETFIVKTKLKI